ncbi:MAG TPA: hypothetical protein VIY28_13530 [Pseudonocardiaceae bacterium]
MPIRTHRGRAAVYRTFWGWPLRSPRHLAGTVLALVAITAGLGLALPDSGRGPAKAASPASPRVNNFDPASRAALPAAEAAGQHRARSNDTPAPAAALTVAGSWMRAFVTVPKGISSARWTEQLRPYTTDELLPQLRSVDPANIPQAQISGPPRTVSSGESSAEVDVPTTVVVVRLLLVSTPAGWRVASYERAG